MILTSKREIPWTDEEPQRRKEKPPPLRYSALFQLVQLASGAVLRSA